jgi:NADH dehydrogenase
MERPLVLVVGGGFAGLEAAKTLARSKECELLLVDVENFSLFTPMLPEVATGDIETRHILVPFRDLLPPESYRQGRLLEVDLEGRTAVVETKIMPRRDVIRFDHAVFAPGGVTSYFGVPGAEECSFTFKTIADAVLIRNHIMGLLERASVETSAEGRERLCRVVIVGAGYSGVELAAALADFFEKSRRQYPELTNYLAITVVEAQEVVAPMLPPRLQDFTRKRLLRLGVDLRLSTRVERVTPDAVDLAGGESLLTLTTVWAAGAKPSPELAGWGLPLDRRGRVRVDRSLRVEGFSHVWAVGDAAAVPMPDGTLAPPTAQHAMREGMLAAKNILALTRGREPKPFDYRTMGGLVSLGHRSAAGIVMGFMVRGFPAWWMWRTYYLLRLPTWLRKIRVAVDWTMELIFQKDIVQLPVLDERRARRIRADFSGEGSEEPGPPGSAAPR